CPHLAENLPLARHQRVEAGRDAEQVERRGVVVQPVERLLHLRLELRERGNRAPLGRLTVDRRDVQLRAVAGREADALAEAARQVRRGLEIERDALPQLDGRVVVGGADEDEAHQAKWAAGRARRTTITSTNPASARYAARRPVQPRTERRTT